MRRGAILGVSGSGKTTLVRRLGYAIKMHRRRRREWPARFVELGIDVVRLRTPREVETWVVA